MADKPGKMVEIHGRRIGECAATKMDTERIIPRSVRSNSAAVVDPSEPDIWSKRAGHNNTDEQYSGVGTGE